MGELYNETFKVVKIDPPQFDNIKRIYCVNQDSSSKLTLDINSQVYDMRVDEVFSFVLKSQISSEAPSDSTHWHPSQIKSTEAAKFNYVMYGKVYRYEDDSAHHKATVYVSYGGLLMSLQGEQHSLSLIPTSRNIYLLMREIKS
ncbi:DNA-directed RNA polymerases I, II, and III subunit RPABC3 [Tritrichomonas musculus]|uniref:DNA-directed RNA polymerases I, II, and III subunit RPABC3 n=1 Tax=Tritrichomonas musculus TaxID=1915356 RepID=A0ABR2JZZ7_9EUKA